MNNLNFCGMFEELTIDGMNRGSGSEAPVLLGEEKLDEINRNLLDLSEEIKSIKEYYETKYEYMEKYFKESEINNEEYKRIFNK